MPNIFQRVNAVAKAVTTAWAKSGAAEVKPQETTSEVGRRHDSAATGLRMAFDIFGMAPDYLTGVMDCKRLSEGNPIFSAIIDKVVGPVADPETYVKVDKVDGKEEHAQKIPIEKELNRLIQEVRWNENKDELLRHLLNEGGLSMEVIADRAGVIRGLEYRPHYSIAPLTENGRFVNPEAAYKQFDILSREEIATFAKWQIAEANWKESAFHDRGIPYLMSSRRMLSSVGDMLNGVVQKWMRSGGEIETFALKTATDWKDVEMFKQQNKADLTPNSRALIRQIFSKGEVDIQRLHGDSSADSTAVIEFLLELIFMATGVSKEIMGFKGNLVVKDMASISLDSYYRLLNRVQERSNAVLRRACDIQLLTQVSTFGILPEKIEYSLVGGVFQSESTQTKIDTTIKVVELLQTLLGQVENKQDVLEQIIGVLTYDLKDYGIRFKEKLMYQEPIDANLMTTPGTPLKTVPKKKGNEA